MRLMIRRNHLSPAYSIWLVNDDYHQGKFRVAKPVTLDWVEQSENEPVPVEPTLMLSLRDISTLIANIPQELKMGGFDVGGLTGSAEIAAVKSHLEDMRRLAFKNVGFEEELKRL